MSNFDYPKKLDLSSCKPLKNEQLFDLPGLHKLYKLSIENLSFNPFNHRLAAEIHEYEKKNNLKLGFDVDSQKVLFKLLLNVNRQKNKITKEDILKKGVLKPIVVDDRGIVIDGNRRLMILRDITKESDSYDEFCFVKAIVLSGEDNISQVRIEQLETKFNVSEDIPLEYDPINIYLKVVSLLKNEDVGDENFKFSRVADKMGTKYKHDDIQNYYEVFQTMEDYLNFFEYPDQYTLLKKRDDHFKLITRFNKNVSESLIDIDYSVDSIDSSDIFLKIKKIVYFLTSILLEGKKFRDFFPKQNKNKKNLKALLSYKQNIDVLWTEMKKINLEEYCLAKPSQILLNTNKLKFLEGIIKDLSQSQENNALKLIDTIEKSTFKLQKMENEISSNLNNRMIAIIKVLTKILQKEN